METTEKIKAIESEIAGLNKRLDEVKKELVKPLPEFKVGDWVYSEARSLEDYRRPEFIPIFRIEERTNSSWLRPTEGKSFGVHSSGDSNVIQIERKNLNKVIEILKSELNVVS